MAPQSSKALLDSLSNNPTKCKYLNPKFTRIVLTLIVLRLEPPSTTWEPVSGDKLLFKRKLKMHLNLHPPLLSLLPKLRPLLLLRMAKPLLKVRLRPSLRPLLSSTPSGLTPNNKSDGLIKELLMPRTSRLNLISTNLGKLVKRLLTNGELSNSRVTAPTVKTVVLLFLTRVPVKERLKPRPLLVPLMPRLLLLVMPTLMANSLRLRTLLPPKKAKLELKRWLRLNLSPPPRMVILPRRSMSLSPWLTREDKTTTN